MLITVIAIAVMCLSAAAVAMNLRAMASDTLTMVREGAGRALRNGRLLPNLAFGSLWTMIFLLSYL